MEVENKSFIEFLNKSKTSDNLLNKYFSENEDIVCMFKKYDEVSYLPASTRFIFLYREHEKYLSKNKLIILEHEEHLRSMIGLLFILEIHTLSQTLIPINFPNATKIKYKIDSLDDVVCSVYLFIVMEIFKHLNSILSIYLNENEYANFKLTNVFEALNDKDFIKIYPFLFKNSDDLKRFLEFEIKEIKFEDPFDSRLQILLNKIKSSFRELPEQIGCNYSRYLNYVDLRQKLWNYEDDNVALEHLIKKYKVGDQNEYLISTGFKLPEINFINEFGNAIHISENLLPNIFYAESLEEPIRKEIKNLQNEVENFKSTSKFRTYLKFKTEKEITISLISKFIELKFKSKSDSERFIITKEFTSFILFFYNNEPTELPLIRNIFVEDLKEVLLFFVHFKEYVFDFYIVKLIDLLIIATNNGQIKHAALKKSIQRNALRLNNADFNELYRLVPFNLRPPTKRL